MLTAREIIRGKCYFSVSQQTESEGKKISAYPQQGTTTKRAAIYRAINTEAVRV
jgi:hypothetical protein